MEGSCVRLSLATSESAEVANDENLLIRRVSVRESGTTLISASFNRAVEVLRVTGQRDKEGHKQAEMGPSHRNQLHPEDTEQAARCLQCSLLNEKISCYNAVVVEGTVF